FLSRSGDHRHLHSFPTRRSSDLDVAVAYAVFLDEALVIAAGRHRARGDGQRRDDMLGLAGMAHAQAPRLAAGLRPEDREVAGEIDERALDSRLREHERRAIDGVLLAETAEVELHARERQPHAVLTQLDAL